MGSRGLLILLREGLALDFFFFAGWERRRVMAAMVANEEVRVIHGEVGGELWHWEKEPRSHEWRRRHSCRWRVRRASRNGYCFQWFISRPVDAC